MQIEILTIGYEVLSGRTLDTNAAYLARALEEVSVQVMWHTTVGDHAASIAAALRLALDRADGVVMTGGLGPTPDDITRKAVASVLKRPLQLDEGVLESIRERARRFRRKLPPSIETQALIPRGAEVWPNPVGTAPGLLIEQKEKPVILLPGVPQEMEALAREFVVPYLKKRSGRFVESFTLRTVGAFESQLHEAIGDMPQKWVNASLAYLPSYTGVDLRVTVSGGNEDDVHTVIGMAYEQLKQRVAGVLYAEGATGMEEVVGELLLARGWHIAAAESCTGGLFMKRLTDVPGSSKWVERGFVTYSNASKTALVGVNAALIEAHGAVSAPVAEAMARGARTAAAVELGVGITGIAGPDGGSQQKPVGTVFIAVATAESSAVRDYRFVGSRAVIRERSAQAAFDMVRRTLAGLPLEARLS
jgi:nicotinamide-nucleotide amidase